MRTARGVTVQILFFLGFPVLDIPLGLLEEYLSSTTGVRIREDQRLDSILQGMGWYNLQSFPAKLSR